MAERQFMQAIWFFNALITIKNGLKILEDEWLAFKTAHRVLASRIMYEIAAQEFDEEGIAPNLEHAI